jgi:hypothetical protein
MLKGLKNGNLNLNFCLSKDLLEKYIAIIPSFWIIIYINEEEFEILKTDFEI